MRKVFLVIVGVVLIATGLIGWKYYNWIYGPAAPAEADETSLLIAEQSSVAQIATDLMDNRQIKNDRAFIWVAKRMSFGDENVKPGKYRIEPGSSNREIIHMLRLGEQEPVQLIVRASITLDILVGRIASQLMIDSTDLSNYVLNEYIPGSKRFDNTTILSLFIPNTYEVYWNLTAASLVGRFEREYDLFWNTDRLNQARHIGLDPLGVYTLASIVERETYIDAERPIVAGVYLNRLDKNMLLQADPTVQFALGDFNIKRVLYKHLEVDSPYNTYMYAGLPPGPIAMPSMASIQAVLTSSDHDYLFFCAKPGGGGHLFAESLSQHNRNARSYQNWLNENDIR